MTNKTRRERYDREPSLRAIARAQPLTGRGFAASKGVRLPKARATGSTTVGVFRRPDPATTCTAMDSCDDPRLEGYLWCQRHVDRANQLGAVVPQPG